MPTNSTVSYFQNDKGYSHIEIGTKKFMCIGASPPFDHPHVFLNMGKETTKICPYCSTIYIFNPKFDSIQSSPSDCLYVFSKNS